MIASGEELGGSSAEVRGTTTDSHFLDPSIIDRGLVKSRKFETGKPCFPAHNGEVNPNVVRTLSHVTKEHLSTTPVHLCSA